LKNISHNLENYLEKCNTSASLKLFRENLVLVNL
jgi:hypothetical protein